MSFLFRAILALLLLGLVAGRPSASDGVIEISGEDCRHLLVHADQTGAAYRPGVDVRGEAVAPADLDPGGALPLPETFKILVTVDVMERLGLGARQGFEAEALIGVVEVQGTEVTLNGRPLTRDAARGLAELCREAMTRTPPRLR